MMLYYMYHCDVVIVIMQTPMFDYLHIIILFYICYDAWEDIYGLYIIMMFVCGVV